MAGYGYVTKGYTTYDNDDAPYYQGYGDNVQRPYQGYTRDDHVYRPVIVDSERRKQPIISYNRPGYVPRRESTFVDRVHSPEYAYNDYESPQNWQTTKHAPAPTYTWAKPKKSHHQPLPTTTTGLAADLLGRAITDAAPPAMQPLVQKVESYMVGTIDNREAARKKSHPSTTTTTGLAADVIGRAITEAAPPSMQPLVQKVETYVVEAIDNREATRRYARPVFKQSAHETYAGY